MSLFSYMPPIIAHRGASALAPENTLTAFRKAAELGMKWVEFDVMLTACGEAVVIHDESLERTTNGYGLVAKHSYAELCQLDAGAWFNPAYVGEKIPTLAEVIAVLQQYRLAANVEIKPSIEMEDATVKKVLAVIAQHWQSSMPPPLISSFSPVVLERVRHYSSSHYLAYLMDEWQSDWQIYCNDLNCVSVNVNQAILDQAKVQQIKATHRFLLSYTVDDPVRAIELFKMGVDAIFSNCPPGIL